MSTPTENKKISQDDFDILAFLHCKQCLEEVPVGQSPAEFARVNVFLANPEGIVLWCVRHDELIVAFTSPEDLVEQAEDLVCPCCNEIVEETAH
jgi:hypothetical protein